MLLVLGIGTNLGNRRKILEETVSKLTFMKDLKRSTIIETPALLLSNSPKEWDKPFLNMAVAGECDLDPEEILKRIKQIERLLGRKPKYEKWSPRIIDIDILLYGERQHTTYNLQIPHPELFKRDFALIPAREIAGELVRKVELILRSAAEKEHS